MSGQRYEHYWETRSCFETNPFYLEEKGWELVSVQHLGENRIYYWKRPVMDMTAIEIIRRLIHPAASDDDVEDAKTLLAQLEATP